MSDNNDWPDFGSDNRDELFYFAERLEYRAERAEKAESRVAELEERVSVLSRGEAYTYVQTLEDRSARLQARVAELEEVLTPPEGHVAVLLPRNTAHALGHLGADWVSAELRKACRKALEEE